jgi:hypothetical protein
VQEFFLRRRFAGQKVDVVNRQKIGAAHSPAEGFQLLCL